MLHESYGFSDEYFGFFSRQENKLYYTSVDNPSPSTLQEGNIFKSNEGSNGSTLLDKLVPGNSRDNWNAVTSPDGTKIAFMSSPIQGTNKTTDVYIISTDGGDPVKVTGYSIKMAAYFGSMGSSGTEGYLLIDWI